MITDKYSRILKQYWGYDDFRGIQRQIIESIGAGRDTLGLMPTGGGKSITFQVPALAEEGVCIVITPLIALMKDQVMNLKKRNIRAGAIYSGMTRDEILVTLDKAVFGALKLLYVSPERLGSELFQTKLRHTKVSFITVDEAHCISQWGYDFRPSYLEIATIREMLPGVPVLALTATATPGVIDDIQQRLGFAEKNVFRMSFERTNLAYVVRPTENKYLELVNILKNVEGSSIVYVRSRQRTKEVAQQLSDDGFTATFYHAGLDNALKDERQKAWQKGDYRVMVATNAFGMGIDKPDVRTVVHIDCPDSIEAYFQEAGRAGRDGLKAYAILLFENRDRVKLQKRVAENFPEKDYIRDVYDHLAYFYQIGVGSGYNTNHEFNIDKFCHNYHFFPIQVTSALHLLDRAGYIEYTEERDNSARLMFELGRDDLYRLHNNSPEEDKVIVALLRNYSGLFSDFAFIDEGFLAQQTGLDQNTVYHTLRALNQKRILTFIPRKQIPMIRYTQRREEGRHLVFDDSIYADRKKDFEERIKAVLYYTGSTDICRSRLLLSYFGEDIDHDCGQCDVCVGKRKNKREIAEAENRIVDFLKDGEKHHVTELQKLYIPSHIMDEALQNLIEEERIVPVESFLTLNEKK